ncbi:MAG: selenocysteine-specific translation elongation factor [Chloroflexi bacterium]|nr:selenocysteine-specific translation elongation factor [Chloroflexota bacterium]
MFVVGTAGHTDHGKSALVRALTGIDPDRLREEKERGMTIDLGFAWLRLPSGREVGIVDVPGHERFIKNMLAGVGGVDLALLVVAANEGVMPQTREHLAILDLLELQKGVVVITKTDLVDDEWLDLVRTEVDGLVSRTALSGAPVLAVSAVTGEGLPGLVSAIDALLATLQPKSDLGRPRLAIDRVFTIAGAGTVVTGTLVDGSLTVGQTVEIVPAGLTARLRGLQVHKSRIDTATPGSRVAANLVGVATAQLRRGDVLASPGWLAPTTLVTARLRSIARRTLRHNTTVNFYAGADEAAARVRLLEGNELQPGGVTWAQLLLGKPVAVVNGDHFIIRSSTETLGGGRVVEAHARRLRRLHTAVIESLKVKEEGTPEQVILTLLEAKQPVELSALSAESNLPAAQLQSLVEALVRQGKVVLVLSKVEAMVGEGAQGLLLTGSGWRKLCQRAASLVGDYHQKFPARAGMPREEVRSKLKLGTYAPAVLQKLIDKGVLVEQGMAVRLPSHRVQLTPAQQASMDAFLDSLRQSPYAPPADLIPGPDLLNLLIERRQVVKVSDSVVFSASAYDEMAEKVTEHIKARGRITLAEVRDLFNTSRKYAQAFLEHLDGKKITRRVGDERVLY